MKKRISAIILLCAILYTSFAVSCSAPKDNTPSDTKPVDSVQSGEDVTTEISDDLPEKDNFDGYKFNIYSSIFLNRELAEYVSFDELTGDPVNDALFYSTLAVEERFNCDISILRSGVSYSAQMSQVKASVTADDRGFDMTISHDIETVKTSLQGYFLNFYDVEQFNFEKPWWPDNTVESLTIFGRMYVGSSYLSYCGLHWTRALLVNKNEFENAGLEIPYDKVRAGTWYLDDLITLVVGQEEDLNGNGKWDANDFYGFATGTETWYCMQESLGIQVVSKDASVGGLGLNVDIDKTTIYLDKIKYLMKDSKCATQEGWFAVETFRKGKALIAFTQIGDAYDTYRSSDVNYGFLPAPKFDEYQKEYISTCTDALWAIPTTSYADIDKVGTIIEALSASNYKNVIPAYFEVAMKRKLADVPEDAEMLDIIQSSRTIGFAYAFELSFRNLVSSVVDANKEFASFYAQNEKAAKKALESLAKTYDKLP